MKRNMDLIRDILIELESCQFNPESIIDKLVGKGYGKRDIYYHNYLIYQSGLIEGYQNYKEITAYHEHWKFPPIMPTILTWKGHDFIRQIQNQPIQNP
jgi:hypothetical protein